MEQGFRGNCDSQGKLGMCPSLAELDAIGFPAAIACFKTFKFRQSYIMRIKVVSSDKATGQLQHAGRQKQG
ncbi:MAG: hypothetical protein UE819_09455, partial [Ruminococcus sp.]|nr:hypothetical protein [Ruminococcus sp.]